jgi:hypothetical protein
MAKYSMKKGGKEVGPASVYAEPHTMSGKKIAKTEAAVTKTGSWTDNVNMSVAAGSKGNYPPDNRYGVGEMRGYGAATKGRKISGKMG